MTNTYLVKGMTCEGCVRAVTNAILRALPGASVEIDLASGRVSVANGADEQAIARAVVDAGFDFAGPA
ncbi:MAG: heavy-metal-associated domain-containing protein [Alphaproteobacteria bacterium]